jgi:hypothetical protein
MRHTPVLLLVALAGALALAGEAPPPPPLPETLLRVIETELPGLAPAGAEYFDPALVDRLDPPPAGPAELGRGRGDLDGDGREDWALLLTGAAEHLMVVFLDRGEEAWQVHVLSRTREALPAGGDTWLRVLPGDSLGDLLDPRASGEGRERSARVLHDLIEMGSGGKVWITHWDRGRPVTLPRPAPGE